MNKNIGPFLAFDKQWFDHNQRLLLWLLNSPLTKKWFRWIMCIDNSQVINRIEPNAYWFSAQWVGGGEIAVTVDFRTHAKYSKRLYDAFKSLWWVLHFWDWLIADRFIPKLSYGFLTLTQFPGSIGTNNPVDGIVQSSSGTPTATWGTIRGYAGDASVITDTIADVTQTNTNVSSLYITMTRGIYCFDTSSLTSSASISAATLSPFVFDLVKSATGADVAGFSIDHCSPASTTTLANGDFNIANWDSVKQATDIAQASITTSAYNTWTFNATGIGNISKTGTSKFGIRTSNDLSNIDPVFGSSKVNSLETYMSDQTGTTNDPKLVVTYTIAAASTGSTFSLMGVG